MTLETVGKLRGGPCAVVVVVLLLVWSSGLREARAQHEGTDARLSLIEAADALGGACQKSARQRQWFEALESCQKSWRLYRCLLGAQHPRSVALQKQTAQLEKEASKHWLEGVLARSDRMLRLGLFKQASEHLEKSLLEAEIVQQAPLRARLDALHVRQLKFLADDAAAWQHAGQIIHDAAVAQATRDDGLKAARADEEARRAIWKAWERFVGRLIREGRRLAASKRWFEAWLAFNIAYGLTLDEGLGDIGEVVTRPMVAGARGRWRKLASEGRFHEATQALDWIVAWEQAHEVPEDKSAVEDQTWFIEEQLAQVPLARAEAWLDASRRASVAGDHCEARRAANEGDAVLGVHKASPGAGELSEKLSAERDRATESLEGALQASLDAFIQSRLDASSVEDRPLVALWGRRVQRAYRDVLVEHTQCTCYEVCPAYKSILPLFGRGELMMTSLLGSLFEATSDVARVGEQSGAVQTCAALFEGELKVRGVVRSGAYQDARALFLDGALAEAAALLRAQLSKGPPPADAQAFQALLAAVEMSMGRVEEATIAVDAALGMVGAEEGSAALVRGDLLNLKALVRLRQGELGEAQRLLEEAVALHGGRLGVDHPWMAPLYSNLGAVRWQQGELDEAHRLARRALELTERYWSESGPAVVPHLTNLAILERARGRTDEAITLGRRALELGVVAYGPAHPRIARLLENLAMSVLHGGDKDGAVELMTQAVDLQERELGYFLDGVADERERLAFVASYEETSETLLSLAMPAGSGFAYLAWSALLGRKGRLADTRWANRQVYAALKPNALERWRQARDEVRQAGRRALSDDRAETRQAAEEELARRQQALERAEAELARDNAGFAVRHRPLLLEDVRRAIPEGAALIEFARFRPFELKARRPAQMWGEPRYMAFVLTPRGILGRVDLGEAARVDALVGELRQAIKDCLAQPAPCEESAERTRALGRELHALLVAPLEDDAEGAEHLLLAPDGQLNLLPFQALVDDEGRYLIERRRVTCLSSARDLHRLAQIAPAGSSAPVVLGDPDFGVSDQEGAGWSRLPGTRQEALEIAALMRDSALILGEDATESAVREVSRPAVLHLATHGYFASADAAVQGVGAASLRGVTWGGAWTLDGQPREPREPRDLLDSSGLVMAGANRGGGLLTAREFGEVALDGTELVVLSACETGLGHVFGGQGVYGLRRALVVAGSRTQVMSLWSVGDSATRTLMTRFYMALRQGQGRGEALRQAQLDLLASPETRHPVFWAAFQASGDWAPIDGALFADDHSSPPVGGAPPATRGCACGVAGGGSGGRGAGATWLLLALGWAVARRKRRAEGDGRG